MNRFACKLGFWSAVIVAVLVVLIDVATILSAILFPMTTITNIEDYARSFTSLQMLPYMPSLMLAPMFVILKTAIHHIAPEDKKTYPNSDSLSL